MTRGARRRGPGTGSCAARGWTEEMDAALRDGLAQGLGVQAIADHMARLGLGARSADTVKARAERLDLLPLSFGEQDGPLDCRGSGEADRLLAALQAAHMAAPRDVVPPSSEGRPLNWRPLVPSFSGAGSPAALCVAEGDRTNWG